MNKLNLASYGVEEMRMQEMRTIDGGNIFSDAWKAIKGAVGEWFEENGVDLVVAVLLAFVGVLTQAKN